MSGAPQPVHEDPQTDSKASGSLVCGILGLLCVPFLCSIVAVVLGHLALGNIKRSQGRLGGAGLAIGGLATGYLGLLWGFVLTAMVAILLGTALPAMSVSREKARRVHCAGNLKQIALACLMYSGDHQGQLPPDLATLAETHQLPPGQVYCCPGGPGDHPPQSAADLRAGKCDYVYVGAGARDDDQDAARQVIAYDRQAAHHGGDWLNVMFLDGHVEGVQARSIEVACALKGWRLPPRNRNGNQLRSNHERPSPTRPR